MKTFSRCFSLNIQSTLSNEIIQIIPYEIVFHPVEDIQSLVLWYCFLRAITDLLCQYILDHVVDMSLQPNVQYRPFGDTDEVNSKGEKPPFLCNIFQQDVEESIDIYCSQTNVVPSALCKRQLHYTVEATRAEMLLDYERNKDFNYIRMGIWHYRNVIWLRHNAVVFGSKPITLSEICEMFPLHEVESVPEYIWEMAIDVAEKPQLNCSEARLSAAGRQLPQQFSSSPSLHVVLVTMGHRPQLFGMLASLQELTRTDFLTIIIDNSLFAPSTIGVNNSKEMSYGDTVEFYHQGVRLNISDPDNEHFLNATNRKRSSTIMNLRDIERYARGILTCRVRIIVELSGPLGHWGHVARNMYGHTVLDLGGDFVWHVDDDNFVLPGAVRLIKATCNDLSVLYFFRATLPSDDFILTPWQREGVLAEGNVDTASGIIPAIASAAGWWALRHGGDFNFYESIIHLIREVRFIDQYTFAVGPRLNN